MWGRQLSGGKRTYRRVAKQLEVGQVREVVDQREFGVRAVPAPSVAECRLAQADTYRPSDGEKLYQQLRERLALAH